MHMCSATATAGKIIATPSGLYTSSHAMSLASHTGI